MRALRHIVLHPDRRTRIVALVLALATVGSGLTSASAFGQVTEPVASTSCGSVLVEGSLTYDLTIVKGSPSCSTVRRIAKKFGHPISKQPKFYCGTQAYECEYSIYPEGWRCGGTFQGHWQCWHGANSPARAKQAFEGAEDFAGRTLLGKPHESVEFYAAQPNSRFKLECAIYAAMGEALCSSFPPREGRATVDVDGDVVLCRVPKGVEGTCLVGNLGEGARTVQVGGRVNAGPFRCSVLRSGVKCVVRATGKGFLFSSHLESAVGGASVERTGGRTRPAVAAQRVKSTGHCGPLSVGGFKVRFLLYGGVTCKSATSVYKAYVRKAEAGECEGNGCYTKVQGWDCVEQIATPVQEETGEIANCEKRSQGIRVFAVD